MFIIQSNKEMAYDITISLNDPKLPKCHPKTEIIILVTSNAPNLKIRRAQRSAYPSNYLWQEFKAIRLFMVAKDSGEKVMSNVQYEQDVILGNFQESYKHLSFKHILGLSWATSR